jgi:hypothetical protein
MKDEKMVEILNEWNCALSRKTRPSKREAEAAANMHLEGQPC